MSDYPMLISNKLHSFRNFIIPIYKRKLPDIKSGSNNQRLLIFFRPIIDSSIIHT